jgi:hypothetical protein
MSIDLHYLYHPVGAKWGVGTTNPTQAQLATIGNWTKVFENQEPWNRARHRYFQLLR